MLGKWRDRAYAREGERYKACLRRGEIESMLWKGRDINHAREGRDREHAMEGDKY